MRPWQVVLVASVVLVAVVVVLIGGGLFFVKQKNDRQTEAVCMNQLAESWSGIVSALGKTATEVEKRGFDFADFGNKSRSYCNDFENLSRRLAELEAPKKFLKFKKELGYLADHSASLFREIELGCNHWQDKNFQDLDAPIDKVVKQGKDTRGAWPIGCKDLEGMDFDSLSTIPKKFNDMRQARRTSSPSPLVVLPAPSMAVGGWITVVTPSRPGLGVSYSPNSTDYLESMRRLLRSYKNLRGDLESYIAQARKSNYIYQSAYGASFDQAYASRQNILSAMRSLSSPPEYQSAHQAATACLERGLTSMDALKGGDYTTFHNLSSVNTDALAQVMRAYGM